MTMIKPLTGGINLEVRHIGGDGHALINVGPLPKPSRGGYVSEQSARYPVADLLAALDATANADAEAKLLEQYRRADKAEAEAARFKDAFDDRVKSLQAAWDELGDLRAEHDALAATVERVRAWAEDYFGALEWDVADEGLLAVLKVPEPPKPFVLPTEAGAGITATYRVTGEEYELRLFSNGSWFDSAGDESTPEQLMDPAKWTDHRLLDGAQ